MYVEDMSLAEAHDWAADLHRQLAGSLLSNEREQLTWDLEDVTGRIEQVTAELTEARTHQAKLMGDMMMPHTYERFNELEAELEDVKGQIRQLAG
ncbi:hypothetical protein KIV66_gp80 [Mycobacterium phage MyraDee]|uniref:Uncharacterized protein n=1 Tax=Mycobacterium phage MyraDee TaxID=2024303 RepID=A0A222YZR6_9CAUD|nr:hypothetical protein KIV66_gp80 [Mycobacterium phage MyraDee]ASR77187.1 hypothetical protein SEA_MYRADEE_80 [Mycobacterium phage MyraDee]